MRRVLALLLAAGLLTTPALAAETPAEETAARGLYDLGLFKGVGTGADGGPDFGLDRAPSRVEAVTMLVRALGAGEAAEAMGKTHPFADVPAWADGYVSYAYGEGLTRGVSETAFGSETTATCGMYLTFMLRALGYTEGEGGDFTYDDPWALAETAGLLPAGVDRENFTRGDVAEVTAAALRAGRKGETATLADALIAAGAFTEEAFAAAFPAPMSYEEALEAVAGQDFFTVERQVETPACTVVAGSVGGTPHGSYAAMYLIFKAGSLPGEGTTVELPLAAENAWGATRLPEEWALSDDQAVLTYAYRFDEPLVSDGRVWHEAGTYRYTVDLTTGAVEEALEPLSLDETLAWFDGQGYTVERTLDAPACTVVLCHRTLRNTDAAGSVIREAVDYELYLVYKAGGTQQAGTRRELPLPLTDTETTAAGDVVLKAGQTPQASPDTADFSVSSMGFDGEGRFHIRLEMAEGFDAGWLLALPYNAAGEQMGTTQGKAAVDGGVDFVIGGVTPADGADMACIRVYGAYRGPEAAIEGSWTLPVTPEPAEERTLTLDRQAGPYRLDTLELSPLSAALTWSRTDGGQGHPSLQVTFRDGTQAPLEGKGGDLGRDYWIFTQPLALEEVASVTIAGETFPVE